MLAVALLILVAIAQSSEVERTFKSEYEAHQRAQQAQRQEQSDAELENFFFYHSVPPDAGTTLFSFGDMIKDDAALQETVRRRVAHGWNMSFLRIKCLVRG